MGDITNCENIVTGYPSIDKPWLKNYPNDAREDVLSGINVRMYDFMCNRVQSYLDFPAIEYFGISITYSEMLKKIELFAKALYGYGIKKGDFISVCLPNIPEIAYLKYAVNRIGAVANMIDPRTNAEGILERVQLSDSKLLFMVAGLNDKIEVLENKIKNCKIILISPSCSLPQNIFKQTKSSLMVSLVYLFKNNYNEKNKSKFLSLKDFLELGNNVTEEYDAPYEPNMPVTAIYTSGTTADKICAGLFTNENYNALVKNMKYGSPYIQAGKRFLGVIPFFVAYGSFCGLHHSFCNAWNIVMFPKFNPNKFTDILIENRANAVLGVPKFWEQFLDKKETVDLSFLEIPVVGGDWISNKSVIELNKYFEKSASKAKLKIGYGATEFAGVISTTSDNPDSYNPESVGILLPGNSAMIIDPDTHEELMYDEEGELCISSPTMMKCYFNDNEKTEKITLYKDGMKYYKTGDKAKITSNGDIIFCDRYKRVIMRPDGHTVASVLIENVIYLYPNVKGCAVVGLKTKEGASGYIPTAFVALKDTDFNKDETAKKIDEFSLTKLGERDRALAIIFVDSIPYTLNGKVDFKKLEQTKFEETEYFICESVFFE